MTILASICKMFALKKKNKYPKKQWKVSEEYTALSDNRTDVRFTWTLLSWKKKEKIPGSF